MNLETLEWSGSTQGQGSGYMSSGGNGPMASCCPSCGGINPKDPYSGHFNDFAIGHKSDCELKKELSK